MCEVAEKLNGTNRINYKQMAIEYAQQNDVEPTIENIIKIIQTMIDDGKEPNPERHTSPLFLR